MKRIIALLAGAVLFGALAGCTVTGPGGETPTPEPTTALKPSEYSDRDFDTSGDVIIITDKDTYGSGAAEVAYTIRNNTAAEYTYGLAYAVEVSIDGKWYEVPFPENTAWDAVGIILKARGTNSHSFKFADLDYEFAGGKYRLIKEIGDKRYFAEFRIDMPEATPST